MNTLIKRQTFLAAILLTLCVPTMPATSQAQNQVQPDSAIPLEIVRGVLTNNGKEATLSNVVDYLQRKDETLNVVLPAELGQIKIGDLRLHGVSADLALQAVSVASGNQFIVQTPQGTGLGTEIGRPLFAIEKTPSISDVVVQAFSLTGYLSYMKFDLMSRAALRGGDPTKLDEKMNKLQNSLDVLEMIITEAIEAQQKFNSASAGTGSSSGGTGSSSLGATGASMKPPTVKFYKDADLLIVIGSPQAVETASKIVNALPGQSEQHFGGSGESGGGGSQYFAPVKP